MVFPFLGDGTAFVRLASRFPVKETILIDSNPDLIHAYRYIKEHPADIIRELEKLLRHYWTTPNGQKQLMCEEMRHLYDMRALSELGLAVCYIFLQMPLRYGSCAEKAATTSLVDENREGTPIFDADNLRTLSALLRNTTLICGKPDLCTEYAGKQAFIYINPPHSSTNPRYLRVFMGLSELRQMNQRVAELFTSITERGSPCMANLFLCPEDAKRLYNGHIHPLPDGSTIVTNYKAT